MQSTLKIGNIEINRYALYRIAFVGTLLIAAWGSFQVLRLFSPAPLVNEVQAEIEAQVFAQTEEVRKELAAAKEELAAAESEAKAILLNAEKEAAVILSNADADAAKVKAAAVESARVAAIETNREIFERADALIQFMQDAQKNLERLLKAQLESAQTQQEINAIQRRFEQYKRQFVIKPSDEWNNRWNELRTAMMAEKLEAQGGAQQ